jgi:proteasome accessory factor B
MDRLERLVNLVAALLDAERPLTRQEIRDRVGGYSGDPEAFRRNFERDKELLREMGLPLVVEQLDADRSDEQLGYRIPRERYELPDPGLTEDELTALRLAASAVQMQGAWALDATTAALRKLAAATSAPGLSSGGSGRSAWEADPGRGEAARSGNPARTADPAKPDKLVEPVGLAALAGGESVAAAFGAIAERRQLCFRYRDEERVVDPWRLSYRRGRWYLAGWDRLRQAERLFRLDRVSGQVRAVGPPGAFERPSGAAAEPPPAWRLGDDEEVLVDLRVDASQAPWALAAVGADTVVGSAEDGSVLLRVPVTNQDAFRSFVLGFLDHAEIVAPGEVRADLVDWLSELADPAVADRSLADGPRDESPRAEHGSVGPTGGGPA